MDIEEVRLSRYGTESLVPSPVSRMMASFAADFRDGVDINLGVGYVNERTIPDERVREAVEYVLTHPDEHRLALNYGGPRGSHRLIDALRRFYLEQGIGGLDAAALDRRAVIIGPSGATSLLDAMADVIAPGIVVTADPMYYIYCNALERKGFELLAVPEDDNGIDTAALRARLEALGADKDRVAFIYVITVGNPTSTIMSNARRRELVAIAADLSRELGRKVPLILDQAYEFLIHDPEAEKPESGLLHDELGIVYEMGTLSKILAPALRIGYLIGTPGPLIEALVAKTSDIGFSAPLLMQEAAAYLLNHYVAEQRARVNAGYRAKGQQVGAWIRERLGPYLAHCAGGRAGFYYYLTFSDIETGEETPFFKFLARTTGVAAVDGPEGAKQGRVVYIPGAFCVHPRGVLADRGRRQLRLSYGFEELERIDAALTMMAEAACYARP